MKKIARIALAITVLFLASSAVATTQFDGPDDPPPQRPPAQLFM